LLAGADKAVEAGRIADAERRWREALALDPHSSRALENLAKSIGSRACGASPVNQTLLGEAEALALRWRAVDPGCEPRDLLLTIYMNRNHADDAKALPLLRDTLTVCASDYRKGGWLVQLGGIELAAGDRIGAERDLCAAVALGKFAFAAEKCLELRAHGSIDKYDPGDDWLGHYLLGLNGVGAPALAHLERAAALNPRSTPVFDHLVREYQMKGDKPHACTSLARWHELADAEASTPGDRASVDGEYGARRQIMGCD
jgi:hypothetical protein